MNDSLFAFFTHKTSNADDTEPSQSSDFNLPPFSSGMNVCDKRIETLFLNNGDTRTITLPQYATSDWVMIMARVTGHAKLTTVGVDFDGLTPISAVNAAYGAGRHTGYLTVTTVNVTSFTFEGLADGTVVQYLAMKLIPDSSL